MILGCNFSNGALKTLAIKEMQLLLGMNKICLLEKHLKVCTRRIQMLVVGICFLFLINIIMFLVLS